MKTLKTCDTCNKYSIKNKECTCYIGESQTLFRDYNRYAASKCVNYNDKEPKSVNEPKNEVVEQKDALGIILDEKSDFILYSTKTKESFRFNLYQVKSKYTKYDKLYFASVYMNDSKVYAGNIYFDTENNEYAFSTGKSGLMSESNRIIRSLIFVINKLNINETVNNIIIYKL